MKFEEYAKQHLSDIDCEITLKKLRETWNSAQFYRSLENSRLCNIYLKRTEDFDNEIQLKVLYNDEECDNDCTQLGICIFPESFEIGKKVHICCVGDIHLK